MKVTKNGTVKLEKGEVRVGNFFFKTEEDHIKIQDLNSVFVHRVWRRIPVGIWLENILSMGADGEGTLKVFAAAMWSLFSVAPDDGFIQDVLRVSEAAMKRHPEWYGIEEGDEKSDAEAIREMEEMSQFEEDVRRLGNEEGNQD